MVGGEGDQGVVGGGDRKPRELKGKGGGGALVIY